MTDTPQIKRPQPSASEWALGELIKRLPYDRREGRLVDDEASIHQLMADAIKADRDTFDGDWESIDESWGQEPLQIEGYEEEQAEGKRMIDAVTYHLMEAERIAGMESLNAVLVVEEA
jgi:hypothetical protein